MPEELTIYDATNKAHRFAMLTEGKRAIARNYRETNVSDPARLRSVSWEVSGPVGASQQSTAGFLATDYVPNLDTRFHKRLISKGARTAVTLTTDDPVGVSGSLKLGQFKLGDVTNKLGGPVGATDHVTHFVEFGGYLYPCRGRLVTQVAIAGWTVVATSIMPEPVAGATSWYGKARLGLGPAAPMRTITSATPTGTTYATTQTLLGDDVYAGPLAVGSDRCWYITKGLSGELENLAGYTLNDFETVNNPFQVGDPKVKSNGIGPFGPFTFFGTGTGIFSFTDQNKKVPLSRSLVGHSSVNNGSQFADPGWGWNYCITDIGLRALTSHIDNPVGPGEAMRQFTGHGGRPTAIWAERGELFVVYQTVAGDSYAYRCTFGPGTAQTGQPDFYPWWYRAATTCKAVFSTNTPTNTALVWGEGTNMAYETISRDGRDDLFSARTYDTGGGVWYGTELDRDPHLIKVLRLARLQTKGLATTSSWTLACSFDRAAYLDIGAPVTANGFHTLRPALNGVPIANISGRAFKPRLTQVATGAGASATPPEVSGTLEVEYDERPAYIQVAAVTLKLTGEERSKLGTIAILESFMGSNTTGPLKVRLPDEPTDRYAMVADVTNRRDTAAGIEAIDVILHMWDVA